ncbi:SGT1-like protein [Drosera capensis]
MRWLTCEGLDGLRCLFSPDSSLWCEKNDASLNPPVENAPKSNGPATPADSAPPVTDVILELYMITIRSQKHVSLSVQFSEEALVVKIDIPGEDLYDTNFRLFGKIIPSKSRYNILSTKLEIRLAKAEAPLEFS